MYLDMEKDETREAVAMVGVDASSRQQEAVKNQEEIGVVSQQPYAIGYQTIWAAVCTTAPKKSVTIERSVLTPPAWIDLSNLDDSSYSEYLY